MKDSIDDIVECYRAFLLAKHLEHLKPYDDRLKDNREGAHLEAAFCAVARYKGFGVRVGEQAGKGGVDFLCRKDDYSFGAEVTHIDTASVERVSGVRNLMSQEPGEREEEGGTFSRITHLLRRNASAKAWQMSGCTIPRVLCMGTTHWGAHLLMGKHAAESLLTSETRISVPIGPKGPAERETRLVSDLTDSVFFKLDKGTGGVTPCRSSISGVLLLGLFHDSCSVLGLLHPDPAYRLDPAIFADIPFVKVSNWPCADGEIRLEWTEPDVENKSHVPLRSFEP